MKFRREDRVGVAGQGRHASRRGHIPDADGAIHSGRGQETPIGTEGNGVNYARMTRQPVRSLVRSRVPEINLRALPSSVLARSPPSGL